MKMTKTAILTTGIVLSAVAAIAVVKLLPSEVKDEYFDPAKLEESPANLAVVRPTHFPHGTPKIYTLDDSHGKSAGRMVGRNMLLRDVIGAAWDCNPSRVVLPADAPNAGFDFLVTKGPDPRQNLQEAVRKELGYIVRQETRQTQVWVLNLTNPNAIGLTVSSDNEKPGAIVKDERLYLKHQHLNVIFGGLSQGLGQPVVDKTGLDGYYNFSVPWTSEVQQHMQNGVFSVEGVNKALANLGLSLEQSMQAMEMYVVEKK
jgi:uncharacterized protein (TIGR03435 family)